MKHADILQSIFNNKAFLAPMLSTTDIPFRTICREYGAGMMSTEMVSAKGITDGRKDSYRNAAFEPSERPIAIQVVAGNPDTIRIAIQELLPYQPTVFDINCGCPNERICEAGAGAALLDDLKRMARIIEAAVRVSPVPVSVKVRARGTGQSIQPGEIAKVIEGSGAAYLTMHGRGRRSMYQQKADMNSIREAKHAVSIPVVGNGDIFCAKDAFELQRQTGCDAVMVGRGALGSPWIFRDIEKGLSSDIFESAPNDDALAKLIRRHGEMLLREFGPFVALPRFRKHVMWYLRQYRNMNAVRERLFHEEDFHAIFQVVEAFLSGNPERNETGSEEFTLVEQLFRKRVLYWMIPNNEYYLT